jgi:hypothetical protein
MRQGFGRAGTGHGIDRCNSFREDFWMPPNPDGIGDAERNAARARAADIACIHR